MCRTAILSLLSVACVAASPVARNPPSITIDHGTFTGVSDGIINRFLGVPFAKPPTGNLRFQFPVPNDPYVGTHDASNFGLACPQQAFNFSLPSTLLSDIVNVVINDIYSDIEPSGEDCLTVNIWSPSKFADGTKLPVVVWFFGGGFEIGGSSVYDGGIIVQRSIEMGKPVVYVSVNYRVSAFGFIGGKEVKDAGLGNIGLQDQRQGLRWVQKYISAFNGDPAKVTIWGESAGAISVSLQMIANNGDTEGLFRGAFMQSGSPPPTGDISLGQGAYDQLVSRAGCSGSSDTLQCLRGVPYDVLKKAVDESPSIVGPTSLDLAWVPRSDGIFLTDMPQSLVSKDTVANIPFVTGDNDDEGTLFALSALDVVSNDDFKQYLINTYLPLATESDIEEFMDFYPQDITQGSPYNTSVLNALTPQFKRIASVVGDLIFQAPRRFFLQHTSDKQNTWSFVNKRLKITPGLGAFHASDLLNVYTGADMADYLINFVNDLDPNGDTVLNWPKYSTLNPQLLMFSDGLEPQSITQDDFRVEQMQFVNQMSLKYPI